MNIRQMPHYDKQKEFIDPDYVQVPLMGISFNGIMNDRAHKHKRAQLIYCVSGTFELAIDAKVFLVSPTYAIWIPSCMYHSGFSKDKVKYRSLYFDIDYFPSLPHHMHVIAMSKLLKPLIEKACLFSLDYFKDSPESRIASVIVDELIAAETKSFYLPLSENTKLQKIQKYIITHLSDNFTSENIANQFAITSKTMNRLCKKEMDLTFEEWRQQIKLLKAIELLSYGNSTTTVSQALGYNNDSSFIYMFKRSLGETPTEFKKKCLKS